ncbi:MAG: hypothetical protein ABJ314_04165, partial [Ilumatobacter sp.]
MDIEPNSHSIARRIVALVLLVSSTVVVLTAGSAPAQAGGADGLGLGFDHTCAILVDRSIECFGRNDRSQLGAGAESYNEGPVPVTGFGNAEIVKAGDGTTCAVKTDGTLWCWGASATLPFNDSGPVERAAPELIEELTDVISLDIYRTHGCAVVEDGRAFCWGDSSSGQAGPTLGDQHRFPSQIPGVDNAIEVDTGEFGTCLLLDDATVECMGSTFTGHFGPAVPGGIYDTPQPSGLTNVAEIALGASASCFRDLGGQVRCYGFSSVRGASGPAGTPVENLTDAVQITMGTGHACALRATGQVSCWGDGPAAGAALGNLATPVDVPGASDATSVEAVGSRTCFTTTAGLVKCLGSDPLLEDLTKVPSPTQVAGIEASQVVVGNRNTCAVLVDASPVCWGGNDAGQLSVFTGSIDLGPTTVPGLPSSASGVSVGSAGPCALGTGATQLTCREGAATTTYGTYSATPASFDIGNEPGNGNEPTDSRCAIVGSKIRCLGQNENGQLGNGSTTNTTVLVEAQFPPGTPQPLEIRASSRHTCSRHAGGTVFCWGVNGLGQLGDGTTINRLTPVQVTGLPGGAVSIDIGTDTTCAAMQNGEVWCWGSDYLGLRGVGNASPTLAAQKVVDSAGAVDVAVGAVNACYLQIDGDVFCWGDLESGGRGVGTGAFANPAPPGLARAFPSQIPGFDAIELDAFGAGGTSQTTICA